MGGGGGGVSGWVEGYFLLFLGCYGVLVKMGRWVVHPRRQCTVPLAAAAGGGEGRGGHEGQGLGDAGGGGHGEGQDAHCCLLLRGIYFLGLLEWGGWVGRWGFCSNLEKDGEAHCICTVMGWRKGGPPTACTEQGNRWYNYRWGNRMLPGRGGGGRDGSGGGVCWVLG